MLHSSSFPRGAHGRAASAPLSSPFLWSIFFHSACLGHSQNFSPVSEHGTFLSQTLAARAVSWSPPVSGQGHGPRSPAALGSKPAPALPTPLGKATGPLRACLCTWRTWWQQKLPCEGRAGAGAAHRVADIKLQISARGKNGSRQGREKLQLTIFQASGRSLDT